MGEIKELQVSKKDIILQNLEKIEKWASEGRSNAWICQELGVSKTTFYEVLKDSRDNGTNNLANSIKKGRSGPVKQLEDTMFRSACGFTRMNKKHQKLKRTEYSPDGKKIREWEEMVEYEEEQYYPPDNTAAIFLLKNWGMYANEPVTVAIRQRELELKEKQVEAANW